VKRLVTTEATPNDELATGAHAKPKAGDSKRSVSQQAVAQRDYGAHKPIVRGSKHARKADEPMQVGASNQSAADDKEN